MEPCHEVSLPTTQEEDEELLQVALPPSLQSAERHGEAPVQSTERHGEAPVEHPVVAGKRRRCNRKTPALGLFHPVARTAVGLSLVDETGPGPNRGANGGGASSGYVSGDPVIKINWSFSDAQWESQDHRSKYWFVYNRLRYWLSRYMLVPVAI